jgi:lipopolysaccharide transport system permease protein
MRAPGSDTTLSYAIWLIAGMGPWMATSEALSMSTASIVAGSSLVKNLAMKTEVLVISSVLTSIVGLGVSVVFLAGLLIASGEGLSWYWLLMPVVLTVHYLFMIGIGFLFSTLNVFFRDFGVMLGNLLMILLFITPIFYPIEAMPEFIRKISHLNPFYIIAQCYRDLMVGHQLPNPKEFAYLLIITAILLLFGLRVFRRFKGYFEGFL